MIIPQIGNQPMLIIPDSQDKDNCPKCKKEEEIVSCCKHCGYVYEEEEAGGSMLVVFFIFMFFILLVAYVLTTIGTWLFSVDMEGYSLKDVLILQWEWLKKIRVW
jgi:hypothetical protein